MFLDLSKLVVHYAGQPRPAVNGVSLGLRVGEIGVLIGPSGCGKTTLLRAVAGLERAQAAAAAARRAFFQPGCGPARTSGP